MAEAKCSVDGCDRVGRITKGLCNSHYLRLLRHGDVHGGGKLRVPAGTPCAVDGCKSSSSRFGFCAKHSYRHCRYGDPLKKQNKTYGEPEIWLDAHCDAPPDTDACIIWPFQVDNLGYPRVRSNGVNVPAHREVLTRAAGPPPEGKNDAAHACGVRGCVNVRHIRWASRMENVHDKRLHGTVGVKLSEVDAVRVYKSTGDTQSIADRFEVSFATVHDIKSGRTWRWATGHV